MSGPPPSGSDPNTPAPPQPPGVPTAQPDRGASLALAGFLCGLTSLIAALLGGLLVFSVVPGFSFGEGVLLIVTAVPMALVGLILSVRGRRSSSRRWLAIAGTALSALALVPFLVYIGWGIGYLSYCSAHGCSPTSQAPAAGLLVCTSDSAPRAAASASARRATTSSRRCHACRLHTAPDNMSPQHLLQ